MDVGQVVIKLNGRFAGRASIIISTKEIEKGYVEIAIPYAKDKIKIKKTNIKHILPLDRKIKVTENEEGKSIWNIIEKEGMESFFVKRIKI